MRHLPNTRSRRKIILIALGILALLLGLWVQYNTTATHTKPVLMSATVFSQPRTITPFQLIDTQNKPFTLGNFKGHWSLLFFGFTNCPELCPTTLSTLNQTYKLLVAAQQNPLPHIVFISVDPEADNPERIAKYLSSFNKNFLGATGDQAQLDQLTQELSVLYAKVMKPNEHYSIDHSGTILIINPQGQFAGVFTLPHDAEKIAKDMHTIMSAS